MRNLDDLNDLTKYRLSLILQGTQSGVGVHINFLKFSSIADKKDEEIKSFIGLINRKFRGVLQLVRAENYIVPIIKNYQAEDHSYRILSSDAIALSLIVLLYSFYNSRGPSIKQVEEKISGTKLDIKKLQTLIRELEEFRLIFKKDIDRIQFLEPTNALKACVSYELLVEIIMKIYRKTNDQTLLKFIPDKSYLETQADVGNKVRNLQYYFDKIDLTKQEKEEI